MQNAAALFLFTVLLLGCNNASERGPSYGPVRDAVTAPASTRMRYGLAGVATNATINKTGRVEIDVMEIATGEYECMGQFDGRTLYGHFELFWKAVINPDALAARSIRFKGSINLGDDRSGFEPDTSTTLSMFLNLFQITQPGAT